MLTRHLLEWEAIGASYSAAESCFPAEVFLLASQGGVMTVGRRVGCTANSPVLHH